MHRYEAMVDMGLMPYPMVYEQCEDRGYHAQLKKFQRWVIKGYHRFVKWEEYQVKKEKPNKQQMNFLTQLI